MKIMIENRKICVEITSTKMNNEEFADFCRDLQLFTTKYTEEIRAKREWRK